MRCFQKVNFDQILNVAQQGLEAAHNTGIPGINDAFSALIALIEKIQVCTSVNTLLVLADVSFVEYRR